MKTSKWNKRLSIFLVVVMIISALPLNAMGLEIQSGRGSDSSNSWLEDLLWDLTKPFLKPHVTAEGLPEGAEAEIAVVSNPFTRKSGSSNIGEFLDFYDIKAVDKETGEEIHPQGEVEIKIKDARIKLNQSVYLIHVLDDENVIRNADNVTLITEAAFVSAFKDAAAATEKAIGVSDAVAVEIIDDLTIDGRDITFKTSSFSIFILANNPRLNVRFYNGSTLINTIVVKYADRNSLNTLIYDQPIDTSNSEGVMFRGWSEDPDYTDPDTAKTIKQVRTAIQTYLNNTEGNFEDGTNLDFYAMLFKQFVVTYFDERGVVCLGRDTFLYRADGADGAIGQDGTIDYRINMSYLPSNEGQAFLGWTINPGRNLAGEDETPVYEYESYRENLVSVKPEGSSTYTTTIPDIIDNPIPAKIKGDVYLKAVAPVGNWLVFEENGKGAKYNAPQFVETNQPTQRPCPDAEMTRLGYTFGGWYYSKQIPNPEYTEGSNKPQMLTVIDETRPFTFGGTITEKTTIFAKWNENITAEYTIIIWKQNINGDTVKSKYDFAQSIHLSGNVGDTINVTQNGVGISIPGASFYTVTSSTSDGRYTIVDDNGNYVTNQQLYYNNGRWWKTRTQTSGGCGGTQYEYSNEYTGIVYNNQTSNTLLVSGFHYDSHDENVTIATEGNSVVNVYFNRNEYTLTFQASINNRWQTIKTITALYQQDISSEFPIHGNNGVDYTGYVWEPQNSAIYTTGDVPYIEAMREENTVFHAKRYGTGAMVHMYYYVESLPGHNGDVTYDGKNFDLHQHVQISSRGDGISSTLKEDFSNISGFTQYASNPAYGDDGTVSLNSGNQYTIKFYYTRDRFDISYFDGGYFDGNGNPIDEVLQGKFDTEYGKQILYNDDIVNYNKAGTVVGEGQAARTSDGSNYFEPEREGYVFEGWYVDDRCSSPYTFDTMNGDVKVYAKWRQIQYRVFLIPDTSVGEGKTASQVVTVDPENGLWGTLSQELNFRISYGDKVSLPTGIDANHVYEFGGWYLDPEYKHPFSGNEKLNNSLTDYFKEYNKNVDFTDDMDAWGHGATWNSDTRDAQGNPRNRFWITEKLELYALWRRVLDGADGVKVIYDYATDEVDDEDPTTYDSSSTIAFSDNHIYEERALSYGAAAPAPITVGEGEDAVTYYFRYWVRQEWVESEGKYSPAVILGEEPTGISDARKIYPGESFRVDSQYARRIDHGETSEYFVHFVAVYTEAEPPKVPVIYDANGGNWDGDAIEAVIAYTDTDNKEVPYEKQDNDGKQYGFEIEINKEFTILANNGYLTRTGYTFLGWAFDKDMTPSTFVSTLATETATGFEGDRTVFAGGEPGAAADTLDQPNSHINTLYAIWLPIYDVEFEKDIDNSGLTINNTETFTVNYTVTYPTGVTVDGASSKTGTLTISAGQDPLPKIEGIPEGSTLTYTETIGDNFTSTNATGTITVNEDKTKANGNKQIAITNKRDTTTVTINKTVSSPFTADNDIPFEFTVTATLADGRTVGLITDQVPANGKFTLKHGGSLDVTVPVGATVTVTETENDGFTTTSNPENGTLTAVLNGPNSITFTNTRKTATVTVTKTVVGLDADKNVDFTFNATSTSGSDIINGGQFTLKDGESQTITVPAGAAVTVTETANSNFYTDVNNTENTNTYTTAALAADASETVAFTNTRKITVTAKKVLDNKGVDDDWATFAFPITLSDGTNTVNGTLANNGTMTIDVRYGATVTVSENDEAALNGEKIKDVYVTTYSAESVTADADGIVMTVTNTRKVFTVKVTKLAEGDFDPDKEFSFTATGLTPTSFTLKNNGEKVFADVPYGTVISVTEAAGGNEYDTTRVVSGAVDGDSITVKDNVTIAYTNKIKTYPVVVEKTVVSLDPDDLDPAKKTFTITVSYTLPNGTTGSVEMNLGNGQKNTDEAINKPIVLPYGTTYTVTETQADNFKTPVISPASGTVTGATNVSVKNERDTVDIIIDKDVTYSGDQSTSFIFDVTAPGVSRTEAGENAVTATHGTNSEKITVPKGSSVTITEKNPLPDSTVTSTAGSVTGNATITFTATEDTTVKYVNKRNPLTIKVTKVLKTNDAFTVTADSTMTFPVHIVYIKDDGTESDATYNLKAGEFEEFKDVQYGSTLLVEETLPDDLATQFKTPDVSAYDTTVKSNQDITVTNERDTSTITVTKTVTNEAAAADALSAGTKFSITASITGVTLANGSLNLAPGASDTIVVPKGFTMTHTEAENEDYTTTYKVGDTDAAEGYTASITTNNNNSVEFINHRKPVKVTVKKIFTGTVAGDDALTFPVVVTYVDDTNGETSKTLNLKGGQSETIENVAYGSAVTVTETVDTNLFKDPVIESNIEKITEDGTITVTNERKTATITVKKTVVGPDAQFAFTATAKLGDKAVTLSNDDASFTLGNNGTKPITVPAGSIVTVTEGDYTANYYTDVNTTKDVRVYTSEALAADTNDSTPVTVTFTNTRKVKVTVIKAVSDADAALVGDDSFAIAVAGDGVSRLTTEEKSFDLTKGATEEIWVIYGKSFTVTETIASDLTWKYENPEYAADGTNVTGSGNTFTATADGTVTITNTLKEYQVTVKKTGTSTYPANHPFKFNVEGFTGEGITDGVTEITLGGSKTWTVKAGSKIDVTEQSDDYTLSSTRTVTGSDIVDGKIFIKADTTITFDNTIKTQKVTIKKVIDNSELGEAFRSAADQNATEFSITYVVNDANGSQVKSVSTTIVAGTDITVDGVPYGGSVTVTEAAQTLFDISYTNNGATVKDDSTVITITNKRKATSLTINKTVESSVDADKSATYNFTVTVDGVNGAVPAAVTVTNGEGSTTINGLPLGAKVTVTETVPQYMTVDKNDQVIDALKTEGNALSFKNTRPNIEIPVEKIVKSRVEADYGKNYTFSYEYTVDHKYEGTATISIAAKPANENTMNGTTTVTVPAGATAFKLTEDPVDENLTVTHSKNEINGPITAAPTDNVTVTNERPEIPVEIVKVVNSDINDYSGYAFKFDYTVKFGDQTVESGTKSITGAGSNTEITVPKGAGITVSEQKNNVYNQFNGTDYTVGQVFDVTYENAELTGITARSTVTVTNTRKLVDVTVKKVVDNKWNIVSDNTKQFNFTFNSVKMYTGTDFTTVTTSADVHKLAHDETITLKVPFGATFTASEQEDAAFDTTVQIGNGTATKALTTTTSELTANGTVITFTNTRKTIKVTVRKHVNKFFDEDITETFHFEAATEFNGTARTLPTADQAFDLMDWITDNTRQHVFEVPYGSNIQVKEVNHTGFTSTSTLDGEDYDQNMTDDPLTADALVIIYNNRDRVTITVTKTVATDAKLKTVDEAINFPFTYSWTKNENFKRGETSFTLHHGQEAYTFTVPVGAAVNVNELTDTELTVYNDLKISDVFTTVSKYGTTTDDQTVSFNADEATTVAFTNTHKTVDVKLVKTVNLDEDKDKLFDFTWSAIYGTGDNAIVFTTNDGAAQRAHNTAEANTLLCTVPVGVTVTVEETIPENQGFGTPNIVITNGTVDGAKVTIADIKANETITYTNSRQVYNITFKKTVENGYANDNVFKFEFKYTDNGGTAHTVYLSNDGTFTIENVPYGHTIVITEDVINQLSAYGEHKVADIFDTAISGQSENCTVEGAVVTINVKQAETIIFTNTHKTSTVTITKNVVSKNESDKDHEFPFSASASVTTNDIAVDGMTNNISAQDTYYMFTGTDHKDSFKLKDTEEKTYTIPYGYAFTVGEEPDTKYNTYINDNKVDSVTIDDVKEETYQFTVRNERAQGDLKITKTGTGLDKTGDAFVFKITKVDNNANVVFDPLYVTIHGDNSVFVMQLEAGDYKVEEITEWSWKYNKDGDPVITGEATGANTTDELITIMGGESGENAPVIVFTNTRNAKNWLSNEHFIDNRFNPQLTAKSLTAAVAWDSKFKLSRVAREA